MRWARSSTHCLAGRPPFQGKTVVETLDQVRTQEPLPPSRWQASVPLDLETICLKCLRKEPEKRYTLRRGAGATTWCAISGASRSWRGRWGASNGPSSG